MSDFKNETVTKEWVLGGLEIIKKSLALKGIDLALRSLATGDSDLGRAEGMAEAVKLVQAFEEDIKERVSA